MTIDEAIIHAEEVAMDNTNLANTLWNSKEKARCEECASEHRQLAEWLKELKQLRERKCDIKTIIKTLCPKDEDYESVCISPAYLERELEALALELEPSTDEEGTRWIPVSKKLPKDRNWYLGIFKEADTGWVNPIPFVCDYVGSETKATTKDFWIIRGLTDIDNPHEYYLNLECVAWMPLPNPYETESKE